MHLTTKQIFCIWCLMESPFSLLPREILNQILFYAGLYNRYNIHLFVSENFPLIGSDMRSFFIDNRSLIYDLAHRHSMPPSRLASIMEFAHRFDESDVIDWMRSQYPEFTRNIYCELRQALRNSDLILEDQLVQLCGLPHGDNLIETFCSNSLSSKNILAHYQPPVKFFQVLLEQNVMHIESLIVALQRSILCFRDGKKYLELYRQIKGMDAIHPRDIDYSSYYSPWTKVDLTVKAMQDGRIKGFIRPQGNLQWENVLYTYFERGGELRNFVDAQFAQIFLDEHSYGCGYAFQVKYQPGEHYNCRLTEFLDQMNAIRRADTVPIQTSS